jgi:hypothetical protein
MAKPTIIIVPGAFHKPIHYTKIINKLVLGGYDVFATTHKSSNDNFREVDTNASHFDDSVEINRTLEPLLAEGKEVVIVSHSYGSFPTCASVEGNTIVERAAKGLQGGIKAVINVAGFAFPSRGKSITGSDESNFKPLEYHTMKVCEDRFECLT